MSWIRFTELRALSIFALCLSGMSFGDAAEAQANEIEEIVVQATRSGRRVQDQTLRVEVLSQEEIEEKILMRPGNISVMLNETGGLRVQVTSPALGSANIRTYGMRGRYTQLLADGLPLYGGQASSLGLLQIPPSDLRQVEVIKGAASALYGGQALGGVINLVSKRPTDEPEGEVIVNATSRDAQDVSGYFSRQFSPSWGGSLLTTINSQSAQDLDDDGWVDMAAYDRFGIRPRLFYDGDDGRRAYLTIGAMTEERRGGTSSGNTLPTGEPYPLNQDTERFDLGATFEQRLGNWGVAQLRASGTNQQHDHQFGTLNESDEHGTTLIEGSVAGDSATTTWVAGLAYQADRYDSDAFPSFDYSYESPAVFGQLERDLDDQLSVAASARWDNHSEFGDQFSPRLSLQYRPGSWSIRASWGRGFYAPTPFIEETEATGLSRLEPLSEMVAETAETVSFDVGYTSGAFETSLTLFGSAIEDAVRIEDAGTDRVRLVNQDGITRTKGLEAMGRWRRGDFTVTANYLYLDTREPLLNSPMNRAVPLTPTHSAGLVSIWEAENKGRVGLEIYYVGEQALEDNPYRDESEPYIHVGLLGEMYLGRYRLFLNLENILDVRQTKEDPLLLPSQANNGRWTVDAWSPIDGFIANVGVRINL